MQALVILGSQFRGRLLLDRLNPPDLRGARPSLYFFQAYGYAVQELTSPGLLAVTNLRQEPSASALGVRRGKAALSSGCKPHPANSLPPEAIGAVMEVTKWLKPSISVSRIGDRASEQAAT